MSKAKNIKTLETFNAKAASLGLELPFVSLDSFLNPSKPVSFHDVANAVFSLHGEYEGGMAAVVATLCEQENK